MIQRTGNRDCIHKHLLIRFRLEAALLFFQDLISLRVQVFFFALRMENDHDSFTRLD